MAARSAASFSRGDTSLKSKAGTGAGASGSVPSEETFSGIRMRACRETGPEAGLVSRVARDAAAPMEPVAATSRSGVMGGLQEFLRAAHAEIPSLIRVSSAFSDLSSAGEARQTDTNGTAQASLSCATADSTQINSSYRNPATGSESFHSRGPWLSASLALCLALLPHFDVWQSTSVVLAFSLLVVAKSAEVTLFLRRRLQPYVLKRVESGTQTVAAIQKYRHPVMDWLMSLLAMSVSIECYTALLPVLFWSGRSDLGVLIATLLATGLYLGNCLKDVVCAPRPYCPPAVRITHSDMEESSSQEYGLPSTHTINIVSFSLYMLHHLQKTGAIDPAHGPAIVAAFFVFTTLVIFGRLYLGMHSPVDVAAGAIIGLIVVAVWTSADIAIFTFFREGSNVLPFGACLCLFLLIAYPVPEKETPSFDDHTCFVGVILGLFIAFGFPPDTALPMLPFSLSSALPLAKRVALGLPVVLLSKAVAKEVAGIVWPAICSAMGVPVLSKKYVRGLQPRPAAPQEPGEMVAPAVAASKLPADDEFSRGSDGSSSGSQSEDEGSSPNSSRSSESSTFSTSSSSANTTGSFESKGSAEDKMEASRGWKLDVDIGIRITQYAALAWAVEWLVPRLFAIFLL